MQMPIFDGNESDVELAQYIDTLSLSMIVLFDVLPATFQAATEGELSSVIARNAFVCHFFDASVTSMFRNYLYNWRQWTTLSLQHVHSQPVSSDGFVTVHTMCMVNKYNGDENSLSDPSLDSDQTLFESLSESSESSKTTTWRKDCNPYSVQITLYPRNPHTPNMPDEFKSSEPITASADTRYLVSRTIFIAKMEDMSPLFMDDSGRILPPQEPIDDMNSHSIIVDFMSRHLTIHGIVQCARMLDALRIREGTTMIGGLDTSNLSILFNLIECKIARLSNPNYGIYVTPECSSNYRNDLSFAMIRLCTSMALYNNHDWKFIERAYYSALVYALRSSDNMIFHVKRTMSRWVLTFIEYNGTMMHQKKWQGMLSWFDHMCCKTSWNNFNDPWHASEEIHTNLTCALVTGNIPIKVG